MMFTTGLMQTWWVVTAFVIGPCSLPNDPIAPVPRTTKNAQELAPGEKLYTLTYDVSDIVAKRTFWDLGGQRMELLEGLSNSILDCLGPAASKKFLGKGALHRMGLVNGKKLEIHTDKRTHGEVKGLLDVFRRMLDLAVVVECWLYEVDRKVYDQQIVGKLNRHPGNPAVFVDPATDEFEMKFLEGKIKSSKPFYEGIKPLQTSKVTIQNREQGEIFTWRAALPYVRIPEGGLFVKMKEREIAFAYPGFSFSMTPVVSPDRRRTQVKLIQKVTELLQWKKEKVLVPQPNQDFKEVMFEVPVLQESSHTSHFTAMDGWGVVALVQGQAPGTKASDRVLVLMFTARILIEEEERLIQKGLTEEKKKKK